MSDSPMIRPLCFATDKQSRREHSLLPTLVTLVVYFVESEVQKEILAEVRMFSRSCLAFVLGLAAALALQAIPQAAPQAQPAIPDTLAGHTFKAWFEAFNSGDRALLDAYLHKYDPGKPVDHEMHFRGMTGGFDLLQIVKSEPLSLEFLVKGRSDGITAFGKLEVKDSDPAQVAGFALRATPPGTKLSDLRFKIDSATRTRAIDGAIAQLNESYVFPENCEKDGRRCQSKTEKR